MIGQMVTSVIVSGVRTLAVVAGFVRNEFALAALGKRMETLVRNNETRFIVAAKSWKSRMGSNRLCSLASIPTSRLAGLISRN
jgi:hypothetical protein